MTNASAQVALKTLRTANVNLQTTQDRISTGLKVASADDNPAFFLVSTTQRSDVVVQDGIRENLQVGLGALRTAMAAQPAIDDAILNIKNAIVALENGTAEEELTTIIEQQIDQVREVLKAASYNGLNLLDTREAQTMVIGAERDGGSYDFQTLELVGAGLGIRPTVASPTVAPFAGSVLDLNSTRDNGTEGTYGGYTVGTVNGVNTGTNGSGGVDERTFGISFETGSDITTQQVIYEEGGNVRGLNISIRNGLLVFGGYNLPTGDPGTEWTYREVQVSIEANTRYTAQLVLDGDAAATGEFRGYLNGEFVDRVGGVGVLFDHPGGIGVGRINGNAVVNGSVVNRITGPTGNDFQGSVDKVIAYNSIFTTTEFDIINSYLAEDWLPERGIQYYIGSEERQETASLIQLLEAVVPIDQDGFSTSAALEVLDAASKKANRAFSTFGFYEARLERQQDYLFNLSGSMESGIAALVEADLAEESAKLQAFQVQTQLAQQSLLIANQRPQSLLRLFA
nr:flagellin [Parvularcula mediterranea]